MKKMEQPKEINESTIDYIIDNAVELTHKEKGGRYNACNRVLSKNPDTGGWYEAILYVNYYGKPFVREEKDFFEQFAISSNKD